MSIDPNNLAATAHLTFADEFNGLSIWNGSAGTWSTNWWYKDEWGLYSKSNGSTLSNNNEEQWYINANYAPTAAVDPWSVSNGLLSITAAPADPSIKSLIDGYDYTSGMLNSWHSFSQQYGYFEISAKMPAGQGLWPAFWLLPQDGSWPPEIDVFEFLGHDTDTLHVSVHSKAGGSHELNHSAVATPDLTADFHRYGVNWQADHITFYFDGRQVAQVDTPADLHKPMYMIVNLAVGGNWPGAPDASTPFPATLQVDYIRAYSETPGAASPAAGGGLVMEARPAGEILSGGDHADTLNGGAGADVLYGQGGADRLIGAGGADQLNGNAGDDTVDGGAGADFVYGGKDQDLVDGGEGDDFVHGNLGDDTVRGGLGDDTLRGGQGRDLLQGGEGDDWLYGDRDADLLEGGAGADVFVFGADTGVDRVLDFSLAQGDRLMIEDGAAYQVTLSGGDTILTLSGQAQVVLVGVDLTQAEGWLIAA